MKVKLTKAQLEAKVNLLETDAILAKGGTQKEVRERFGDTSGQKLYCICVLNKRFPTVKLIERMTELEVTSPGYIKYNDIKGSYLPQLLLRSDPKALEEWNRKELTVGREPRTSLDEAGFAAFIEERPGKTCEVKMMNRYNMQALADQCACQVVRDVVKAILTNNPDELVKYTARAGVINGVLDAIFKN